MYSYENILDKDDDMFSETQKRLNAAARCLSVKTMKQKSWFDDIVKYFGIMGFVYFTVKQP